MEFFQEAKIKIQLENNNCIISGLKSNRTNSYTSTNNNTKTSLNKNLKNNFENEISFSFSKSSERDNYNNSNDLSMVEITEKSIFNSELNNGSFNNKTPETKTINKEKMLKKVKQTVLHKLNLDLKNYNINHKFKIKNKNENKYPFFNKIILDYQHKPAEKKIKNNLITKRITKKIKINLNFKEINLHKNNIYKRNKNDLNEECISINNTNFSTNTLNKNKNISYNNIFKYNNEIKNINSNLNSKENLNKKNKSSQNSAMKQNFKQKIEQKLSLTVKNKEKLIVNNNHSKNRKKIKNLSINTLKRNNFNNFLEISSKKYNTYLTTVNNSSILKDNNIKKCKKNINKKCIKDEIKNKQSIKSSNNSANHSHRNTLLDSNIEILNKKNYFSTYNFHNSSKPLSTRVDLRKKESKTKKLKKMLMIFGKEFIIPIKSKNDKTIKKLKLLNLFSDNRFKLSKSSLKKINQ